jgi:hypothetical protein
MVTNNSINAATTTGTVVAGNGTGFSNVPYSKTPGTSTISEWDANSNLSANSVIEGYATTATAAGTTTLTVGSAQQQYFTGVTTQTVVLPVTSTLVLGQSYTIVNNSTGIVTVQSSGANTIVAMAPSSQLVVTVILTSGTTAASWSTQYKTASTLVTTFTTAQSGNTWTMSTNPPTQFVKVYGANGGGGGGSGRMGVSTTSAGGSGGTGSGFFIEGPAIYFPSSAVITVGTGGTGAASQSTPLTNGNPGSQGGLTSFGSTISNAVAAAAVGGTTTNVIGTAGAFSSQYNNSVGTSGGGGSFSTPTVAGFLAPLWICPGGGGGSGYNAVTPQQASNGQGLGANLNSPIAGGAGGIETGTINGANGASLTTGLGYFRGGLGGGGGGGVSSGSVAGTGGNGGFPGGGGGGGGGSSTLSVPSGAGGNGGDGVIIIVESF